MLCFNFLGPCARKLNYCHGSSQTTQGEREKGRKRTLPPLKDGLFVHVRLHLGLFEQDLAYQFGISQTNVPHIILRSINILAFSIQAYTSLAT